MLRQRAKKVVWAPAKDVLKNTIIVLVVVIIAGLAIYGVDSLLSLGMKGIKEPCRNYNYDIGFSAG